MRSIFGFLQRHNDLLERAVDNAQYWKGEVEKAERDRDYWRERAFEAEFKPMPPVKS